ncbi:MAG: PTS fructose transporter subunit IIA [Nitrospirota bacterium]|jgi:PTS system mannose-specific IIA component
MIGILLVTHGQIGPSLVGAAEYILGRQEGLSAVTVDSADLPLSAKRIKAAITAMGCPDGTVILTDMYGGTPSNASLPFLDDENIEIVAGVNLPMLMKCLTSRENITPADLAQRALEGGQRGILVTRMILDTAPPQ